MESNVALGLWTKCLEEQELRFVTRQEEIENYAKTLFENVDPFFKAVAKFIKTGEIDQEALNIDATNLNIDSDIENVTNDLEGTASKNTKNPGRKVKREKVSVISTHSSLSSTTSSIVEADPPISIKKENEEMPAPAWIPPKKKVKEIKTEPIRSTRTRGKKALESSKERDSDVILQNTTIPIINLTDNEESGDEKTAVPCKKSTRTRKPTLQNEDESDTGSTRSTRTKTRREKAENNENEEPEKRSTRTKTIRKVKKEGEETEEENPPTRSTRTKTIRKAKDPEVEENKEESTRSTRTKTRKQIEATLLDDVNKVPAKETTKRNRSATPDDVVDSREAKKSKSTSPIRDNQGNTTTQTVYEDARSSPDGPSPDEQLPPLNSTYVSAKPNKTNDIPPVPPLNCNAAADSKLLSTTVVQEPRFNIFDKKSNNNNMFTDDDSVCEEKTPPKKTLLKKKNTKEVFSPYEKTTTKKKVEAFERLQGSEIPVRLTPLVQKTSRLVTSAMKEKTKVFTPASKFLPTTCSTSKVSKLLGTQSNTPSHESSILRSGQKDPREIHRKIIERDQVLKKKEAMLKAQAEAKRKANEEKQLKAQQQRSRLEAEKMEKIELQKQKEERLKQREQEREEHTQAYLEEKRLARQKKAQEIQAAKQAEMPRPIYMSTEAPKLPTDDCYDSDDPAYQKIQAPRWCSEENSRIIQLVMLAAGDKIKNTLFCRKAQTPDLSEIFESIDPKKLKRSSSKLWRKPPRYTMMPNLNETRFSDDDDDSIDN